MPKLEEFKGAGGNQYDAGNFPWRGADEKKREQKRPEDHVKHTPQGVVDPYGSGTVVYLGIESQGNDECQGEKAPPPPGDESGEHGQHKGKNNRITFRGDFVICFGQILSDLNSKPQVP
jgi:hypothetical protein